MSGSVLIKMGSLSFVVVLSLSAFAVLGTLRADASPNQTVTQHSPSNYWCQDTDQLTLEEKPCTTMRTGRIRSTSENNYQTLEVCSNREWKPFSPLCSSCHASRVAGLIGHWRMDEQTGNETADDSGHENHGSAHGPVPTLSKFSRGRFFDSTGIIVVANSPELNFGTKSFTMAGWAKILDVTYPRTTFAIRKGYGCYFQPGHLGAHPGWDIGHGYQATGLSVCIRDNQNKKVNAALTFDSGYGSDQLLGKWVHYAVVFDRQRERIFGYVNGKKQSASVDISTVKGSVDNAKPLEFGSMYGWKTKGTLDEYRLYHRSLTETELAAIYKDHLM